MPTIPIKVQCGCGQKYSFEVEPVNGQMPWAVACPVCNADGTGAANVLITRSLAVAPAPTLAPAPVSGTRLRPAETPPMPAAPIAPEENQVQRLTREIKAAAGEDDDDKWKWWYYILAGICIGGFSIWQSYTQHRIKPLGELFLAVLCIGIGVWDFQRKQKKQ